ncbi:lectin subunit alpha-like [Stomoxys calcitrans]|uniref:lectin subunit alpha-like n=1 Tax=Stomoxys calcitrans TaxID=35570 RepID=UPI0027E22B31|nr:lectin subunit alpha-like [Stomoxys calcitrans]
MSSAATGQQLIYGSWAPNSPNNAASKEHCVQLITNEYKWDDAQCEQRYGFICEEHYLINKSDDNFSHKRDAINHKNSEIISQFEITQSKVKKSIVAAGNVSEQQIDEYSKFTEENLKSFEKSLKAVFLSKPHLRVIWADIGESILELHLKLQQKQVNLADEAVEKLTEVNSNLADIVDKTNNEFYSKLKQSKYEVAEILE